MSKEFDRFNELREDMNALRKQIANASDEDRGALEKKMAQLRAEHASIRSKLRGPEGELIKKAAADAPQTESPFSDASY